MQIPKAYSYIGREEQSICEKPSTKVINWMKSLDESEEVGSVINNLSNEEMLNDLYGVNVVKQKQLSSKKSINFGTMDSRNCSFNSNNNNTRECRNFDTASSSLLVDCKTETVNEENYFEDELASMKVMPPYTVQPASSMETGDCRHPTVNSMTCDESQNATCNGTDDTPDDQPENQTLYEYEPGNRDSYPYVSLSMANSKSNHIDHDAKVIHDNFCIDYL